MIRAVLFDLDGTLINSLADIASAMNRALRLHGLEEYDEAAYRYLVGNGARILAQRAVGKRQEMAETVLRDYQAWYGTHNLVQSAPYPGIVEMLSDLKASGLRLMVLSNKPDADTQHVIRHFFPEDTFALVRGQREGVPIKPDPTAALDMAAQLGVAPSEMLYLGDTSVDVTCARRAGMHSVGVLWGFRERAELEEAGAEHIVSDPSEVRLLLGA